MKKARLFAGLIVLGLALCPAARADSWTISLLPGNDVSSPAGSTIGWGFTVTNNSSEFLFLDDISADIFTHATPNAGVFTFPEVDPNSSVTVDYAAGVNGLYELTWDADAPTGFTNSGTFVVSAQWCDDNTGTTCTDAPDVTAAYSATVAGASTVPEPAAALLLTMGLGLLAPSMGRKRRPGPTRPPRSASLW